MSLITDNLLLKLWELVQTQQSDERASAKLWNHLDLVVRTAVAVGAWTLPSTICARGTVSRCSFFTGPKHRTEALELSRERRLERTMLV
ncbi:uncharacterized protein BO95DRAFT_459048 [Aspergillus brunneoviolaceus CBS 621.78]|uniref:Uncharacterized protein n=1 Tax=Aspergillus brunneoviolaceus CBS 621.78 TaxID=1450534 RepID=A0ACD1GMQ9_9EURO|nr:hypothetical protein BO95DRAFT_459048 [Aspergillus brunneoviolaceus CBS 621.78]RAH50563.1 hypothetical protein BO95DRAFT_459048 [Aspergillus brunneoviolaceus CBS 621.78]